MTWLCIVLGELGIPLPQTLELYGENLSSIFLTANPAFHKRTKHFELDYHYVRERVALGALEVKHISSHLPIADIFTKPLPYNSFSALRYKLGVHEPPTPSLRENVKTKLLNETKCFNTGPDGIKQLGQNQHKPKKAESYSNKRRLIFFIGKKKQS